MSDSKSAYTMNTTERYSVTAPRIISTPAVRRALMPIQRKTIAPSKVAESREITEEVHRTERWVRLTGEELDNNGREREQTETDAIYGRKTPSVRGRTHKPPI